MYHRYSDLVSQSHLLYNVDIFNMLILVHWTNTYKSYKYMSHCARLWVFSGSQHLCCDHGVSGVLSGWIIADEAETSVRWAQRGRQGSPYHEHVAVVKSLDFIQPSTISLRRLTTGDSNFSFIKITLSSGGKWLVGIRRRSRICCNPGKLWWWFRLM